MKRSKVKEVSPKAVDVVQRLCQVYLMQGFYMAQTLKKEGIDIAEITDEMVEELAKDHIRLDFERHDA